QLSVPRVQVQPLPLRPVTVSPLGGASVTVTAPLVALPPPFETSRLYEPVPPWTKLPVCVLLRIRSGSGGIAANVAVTLRAWSIVTWQVLVPLQAPLQPVKA